MMEENEGKILEALKQDLNHHGFESHATDILGMKTDILEHIKHLEERTADEKPDAGFCFWLVVHRICIFFAVDMTSLPSTNYFILQVH
jgi:hypothetical protein